MKNILGAKLKKINLDKKKLFKEPIKVIKKIKIHKLKNITSFSLNKTFDNFKERIKQAEIERIRTIKKESLHPPPK